MDIKIYLEMVLSILGLMIMNITPDSMKMNLTSNMIFTNTWNPSWKTLKNMMNMPTMNMLTRTTSWKMIILNTWNP